MFDVHQLLRWLAAERPLFRSEKDFRSALAGRIQKAGLDVRVSSRPFRRERRRFDLWLPKIGVAVELRHKTRGLEVDCGGRSFALRTHGAEDRGRCEFLNDLARLERMSAEFPGVERGIAVLLTNDRRYWRPASKPNTVDAAFRLHEGRVVSGKLAWAKHTGPKTKEGMEDPIVLRSSYQLRWRDYGQPFPQTNGRFRYLSVEASPHAARSPAS